MKAIVRDRYGPPDILALREVAIPVVSDDTVLVRVRAASINSADREYLRGLPRATRAFTGLRAPKNQRLGSDMAGQVEAVGSRVSRFRPGDEVMGELTSFGFGTFAEYVAAPERAFAPKPSNLTFEQAATVPHAAFLALHGLRYRRPVQAGQRVLINGASGSVGPFAIQLAKLFGADVTAVCSASKLDFVRAVGADHAIDYTAGEITRGVQRYDYILDVTARRSVFAYRRILTPDGVYACVGGATWRLVQALAFGPLLSRLSDRRMGIVMVPAPFTEDDMPYITDLVTSGQLRPIIDRTFPLAETAAALRYVEDGHARGKVVITM